MPRDIMDQEKKVSIDEVRIKSNLLTNFVRLILLNKIGNINRTQQKSHHKRRLMNLN